MPLIDDCHFRIQFLGDKIKRISDAADAFEDKPDDVRLKNTFIAMVEGIETLFASYDETITKLASLYAKQTPPTSDEILKEKYELFEKYYYNARAIALTCLPTSDPSQNSLQLNKSNAQSDSLDISLPKINLKEFSGDLIQWQSFHDLFEATIHKNTRLSDVQKFMYLKASVKGEAYSVISSIPLTGTNYAVAWELLTQRYCSSDRLTNAYLTTLFDLPPLSSRNSASLRPFRNTVAEIVGALNAIGHNVESWSVLLIFLLRRKLNSVLRERWEQSAITAVAPTIMEFLKFLDDETLIVEAANPLPQKNQGSKQNFKDSNQRTPSTILVTETVNPKQEMCVICSYSHPTEKCRKLLKMSVGTRLRSLKQKKVCIVCFSAGHYAPQCEAPKCSICALPHHPLLCFKGSSAINKTTKLPQVGKSENSSQSQTDSLSSCHTSNNYLQKGSAFLLATAKMFAYDSSGVKRQIRALIDCASQGTFVTEACVAKLGCRQEKAYAQIFGFGQARAGEAKGLVRFKIQSMVEHTQLNLEALVVNNIARCPKVKVNKNLWSHIDGLLLADSEFDSDNPIELLLGCEWFARVVIGTPIQGPTGTPDIVPTIFGHCLLGKIYEGGEKLSALCASVNPDIGDMIKRFWEVEEPPHVHTLTPEEDFCERHYKATVSKIDHRYMVRLPFRDPDNIDLGDSFSPARRRFHSLENRLEKNAVLRAKYNEFMKDLLEQGHMVKVRTPPKGLSYYVPHHCIFRHSDKITKFRVVFDCSMKTDSGPSLNQILHVGPKLQTDIVDILIRFRLHDVVFTTDIRQMYRNIRVHEDDHDFQRIFWRFDPSLPVDQYQLTTVIYGMASSPYLAIRTLHKLTEDEGHNYPKAARVLIENTFMDDCCPSFESLELALEVQTQLIKLLESGSFELRKWKSNRPELLSSLPETVCDMSPEVFQFQSSADPATAVLGLAWNPIKDSCLFLFQPSQNGSITKRVILSEIAQLFDPLGLLCPVTFYGKWLIQELWHLGLDWDELTPPHITAKWHQFREELPLLSGFSAPRSMKVDGASDIQLHAFADASEKGYAATIYIRVVREGIIECNLLLAKSKVAPVRKITIPRLELLALVLAAKLVDHTINILRNKCKITKTAVWSDSLVALHWVRSSPHRWKTFVANRISLIHEKLNPEQFHYVPTASNASDIASRGALPRHFLNHSEWCSGPGWLARVETDWPKNEFDNKLDDADYSNIEEKTISLPTELQLPKSAWMLHFSSFSKLKRVVAYWLRYFDYLRLPNVERWTSPSTGELSRALVRLVSIVQGEEFESVFEALKRKKTVPGFLKRLNPFIDNENIIRVGGRLEKAKFISFSAKHPILLPKHHHLTKLVIDHYHQNYLHPGPLNLHCLLQSQFWIVNGREVIRNQLAHCVKCFRAHPKPAETLMGNLPSARLTDVRPFYSTGVDYAGPYNIRMGKIRNAKIYQGYICLFVCLSTRAIHIELVSDLTTDCFLGALRRFVARRGAVAELHSDGGTNFVGAKRKLEAWAKVTSAAEYNDAARKYLADRNISWKLLPGNSPHMGGIWESNIRCCKRHLSTVIGQQILTYEELNTVLVQIESVLNSRPLGPVSSDPSDFEALTPGHFLLQQPVTFIPTSDTSTVRLRERWDLIQRIVRAYWARWKKEFLNTLQIRAKWTKRSNNICVGQLVIIKEDNLPPARWRLARVTKVFPGDDGVVRVAEVKSGQSVYTRAVTKLCPLPIQD